MIAELGNFNKIKEEIKAPWQQVTHAYYKCWRIFMALYFEKRWLPWFTPKWKKTLANPEPFCATNIGGTNLPSCQ